MKFIWKLVLSRMRRQKIRLLFIFLAIAASSCLVVWTIGGFQALFIDESALDAKYLGYYDLRVASETLGLDAATRGGGPAFDGPLSRRDERRENAETNSPERKRESQKPSAEPERGRRGPNARANGSAFTISPEFLADLRADESVAVCDETTTLRAFVYSPGAVASILEDSELGDEGDRPTIKRALNITDEELAKFGAAPEGVDARLHRAAMSAYRATMGTPMGLGSLFQSTTAEEAPYELKEGRWLQKGGETPRREAVVTIKGNERLKAKPGDSLVLIVRTSLVDNISEYQLQVVGIVDDPENDGFYVSRDLASEIFKNVPLQTNAAYLKIRGDVEEFRARWQTRFAELGTNARVETEQEIAKRKADAFRENQAFQYQATSGTLLAALASLFIVFTALNMSVEEQKRLIAFYRASGLTRGQVGASILLESIILATPGWLIGMAFGWLLVYTRASKGVGLNWRMVVFSFCCAFLGAIIASLYPIAKSARVKPLDAIGRPERHYLTGKRRRKRLVIRAALAVIGLCAIGGDLFLVYNLSMDNARRAALHSGLGVLLLAAGVVFILPLTVHAFEVFVLPVLAYLFRFDARILRDEFSGNASRVVAVAIALSVGGGLFVTMQIWGYSMLDPFLPGRREPDAFAAFLPRGLRPEIIESLRGLPFIDQERFIPIAVEQASFAEGSVTADARKSQFANVVFFGCDVEKAFEGSEPLVGFRFRQGKASEAFAAMKVGRGVVVTDSLSIDYGLNLGDVLKTVHPNDPSRVLEYPIVGVVSFPGWQWLSKTGGVRRNFGRSGGLVFARESVVANDYGIERRSYFWFDAKKGEKIDYATTEFACDYLARKNLDLDKRENVDSTGDLLDSNYAYVKLSTRDSLANSIMKRADSVIWTLSKTPLITLVIASIAVVGAIANSVRARRWQFGVMRAVGASRWLIIRAVFAEAILIGMIASFASFLFGLLAAQGALKLGKSMFGTVDPPLILPWKGLTFGFLLSLALCLAAALYPAIRTGTTEPLRLIQSDRTSD